MSSRHLVAPLRLVWANPGLRRLAVTGALLALIQSVWFTYTTSYFTFALDYSPTQAGLFYALLQFMGIVGRLGFGYLADRYFPASSLILASLLLTAISTLMLAGLSVLQSPILVTLVCVIGGALIAGWNGIQMSETVRIGPEVRPSKACQA